MSVRSRRGLRPAALFATFVALSGFAGIGRAQLTNAPVDLQIFRPAMDSKGFITLNSSSVLGQWDFSFGLVVSYARKPLTFTGSQTFGGQRNSFSVDNLISPSLQGAVGFTKLPHLGIELGLVLPMSVLSGSGKPNDPAMDPAKPNATVEYTFTKQGLGDIQIHPKFRFLNATRGGLGLAVIPSIIFGTGDKNAFLGEGKTIFQPTVVVDTEAGYLGRFRAAINAGMRIRGGKSQFIDDAPSYTRLFMGMPTNTGQGISVGNELIGGLGVSYGIVPQKFDVVGEVYGLYGLDSNKLEIGGGWRVAQSYGGAAPRAFIGFIFEPSIGDRDGDGYKDDVDQCPDDPEDYDDFEDADGCPDPDNDKDRILDVNDKCPNEPETYNGFEDADGCPDKGRVKGTHGKLELIDKIYFETDKDASTAI